MIYFQARSKRLKTQTKKESQSNDRRFRFQITKTNGMLLGQVPFGRDEPEVDFAGTGATINNEINKKVSQMPVSSYFTFFSKWVNLTDVGCRMLEHRIQGLNWPLTLDAGAYQPRIRLTSKVKCCSTSSEDSIKTDSGCWSITFKDLIDVKF